jgi:hypothetical protein
VNFLTGAWDVKEDARTTSKRATKLLEMVLDFITVRIVGEYFVNIKIVFEII